MISDKIEWANRIIKFSEKLQSEINAKKRIEEADRLEAARLTAAAENATRLQSVKPNSKKECKS
jgi:hypothetical protein